MCWLVCFFFFNLFSSFFLQRSVRSRKKLILPDFEYGFDGKFEKDESIDQPSTSTPKNKNVTEKSAPKKDVSKVFLSLATKNFFFLEAKL